MDSFDVLVYTGMVLFFVLAVISTLGLWTIRESLGMFRDLPLHGKQNVISAVAGTVAAWGGFLVIALNLLFG